jgi:hypothetical protein
MASAFVYGIKTLNDNWYEDRVQPEGSLTALGDINNKVVRPYETDIAYVGERYDILTRIGRVPKRDSYATPNDGFDEKTCTSKSDFQPPQSRKEFVAKALVKPRMITTSSVPEVCSEERRPIPGNDKGFRAVIDRHDANHGIRHWNTAFGDAMGYDRKGLVASRSDPGLFRPSGVSTEHEENRMLGMKVGVMCGEEFRNSGQPHNDTKTQRAWVYDAALSNIHHGGTKPRIRGLDNHMSVPIGDGAMSKIRKDLADRQGRLFRVATNITKGRDKRPGVAIFRDDP